MKIVSLAIFFTSMYLVKSASLSVFASKTDLKEGDNVTITTQVIILPGEEITVIKWVIHQNVALASALTADSFAVLPNGKSIFGDRISASYQSSTGYLINLINLRANDSMNLTAVLEYKKPTEKTYGEVYQSLFIDVKASANSSVKVEPGERLAVNTKNTGLIVGVIIGVLVFIVIVLVFVFYRHKKTHPSSNPKESLILKPKNEEVYSHYAASTVSAKSDDKKPPTQQYAELGQGGGRDGPKPKHTPSHYSDVKTDDVGYPAKGPTAQSKPNNYTDDEPNVDDAIIV